MSGSLLGYRAMYRRLNTTYGLCVRRYVNCSLVGFPVNMINYIPFQRHSNDVAKFNGSRWYREQEKEEDTEESLPQ